MINRNDIDQMVVKPSGRKDIWADDASRLTMFGQNICHLCNKECKEKDDDTSECLDFKPKDG